MLSPELLIGRHRLMQSVALRLRVLLGVEH